MAKPIRARRKSASVKQTALRWPRPPTDGSNEVDARNVERTTAKQYKEHVNLHIVPSSIGRTKLAALPPSASRRSGTSCWPSYLAPSPARC